MSSDKLLILSERSKICLSDNISGNPRQVDDVRPTSNQLYKTHEKYFYEQAYQTSTTNNFGGEVRFEIKTSDAFVGEYVLEMTLTHSGTLDLGALWGANLLDMITWTGGGKDLFKSSGEVHFMVQHAMHTDAKDREALWNMYGGIGGAVATGTVISFPIMGPGSKGLIKNYTDDTSTPVWPIGKMNTSLFLKLNLKSLASFDVSATATLSISNITLRYKKYRISGDIGVPSSQNGKEVVYSHMLPFIQEWETKVSETSGVNQSTDIAPIITGGEIQYIGVLKNTLTNYSTNKEYMAGSSLAYLELLHGGSTSLYSHNTALEGDMRHTLSFKKTGEIKYLATGVETTFGRYHLIPISPNYAWDVFNYGAHGVNLNKESLTIKYTAGTTEIPRAKFFAVYKGMVRLYSDQTAEQKYDFSFL